ncbi:Uncharacterised protein [Mycobacterium tuberculosis]|uniref:Uncharacterized protein n=1 Tax=Mycobacterium tuberculosis TaxID=1773 RepID=A0A655F5N7_MYCTX|nr:Uncharacterised protein [Mycobacterium tuberculosis]CFR48274.1 Uncharacterised protein [Mycobacterium tuberculosis]CFS09897.1 Uncharacterised protein [Mycobacterium tuberculosis]CKM70318.1 Uncharacterised protein [Mycobacterium tuberculosis]CKN68410.1 Uncharacterised protein [Mycobacterium tuberculosis]
MLSPHPRLTFRRSRTAQRIGPPANRVGAFLGGAHRQPGFHFDTAGAIGSGTDRLAVDRLGHLHPLGLLGLTQLGLKLYDVVESLCAHGFLFRTLLQQPVPLFFRRAGLLPEAAQLLVHRRDGRVGFVKRGQGLLGRVLAGGLLGQRTGQGRIQLRRQRLGSGQLTPGLVDLGGDLQGGQLAVRSAADPAGAHQITVNGDRA